MSAVQSYQVRCQKRPGYARYKNTKKWLRKQVSAGRISQHERRERQAKAYDEYCLSLAAENLVRRNDGRTRRMAHALEWIEEQGGEQCLPNPDVYSPENSGYKGCDPECVGAEHPSCNCDCEGANHGSSWGRDPRTVQHRMKTERVRNGELCEECYQVPMKFGVSGLCGPCHWEYRRRGHQ